MQLKLDASNYNSRKGAFETTDQVFVALQMILITRGKRDATPSGTKLRINNSTNLYRGKISSGICHVPRARERPRVSPSKIRLGLGYYSDNLINARMIRVGTIRES